MLCRCVVASELCERWDPWAGHQRILNSHFLFVLTRVSTAYDDRQTKCLRGIIHLNRHCLHTTVAPHVQGWIHDPCQFSHRAVSAVPSPIPSCSRRRARQPRASRGPSVSSPRTPCLRCHARVHLFIRPRARCSTQYRRSGPHACHQAHTHARTGGREHSPVCRLELPVRATR